MKKNLILITTLLSAIIVWADAVFAVLSPMNILNGYTLIVFLKGVALVGVLYIIYLCYTQRKEKWAWTLAITALWANASIAGASISLIPMILNVVAAGVVVGALFGLRLEEKSA